MTRGRVDTPKVSRQAMIAMGVSAVAAAAVALVLPLLDASGQRDAQSLVTVYKHPECRCCSKWMDHLAQDGFVVQARLEVRQAERQAALGVPVPLRACHTALVGGYVVEGHVPAEDVRRLLRERPKARGIAVAGMPIGSPGMEQGDRVDPYDVILFDETGATSVFAHHEGRPR